MKALAPTMQKFLVLFKVFFSKVGQTSRSTSWGQQFYYPMKGLVTIKVSHTPKIKNLNFGILKMVFSLVIKSKFKYENPSIKQS